MSASEPPEHGHTGSPADRLTAFYLSDPRVILLPPEHLSPSGMGRDLAALLAERSGWSADRIALFDRGFALYWERSSRLARCTASWPSPRLRHVAVVHDPMAVRPYAQLLNATAWTVYDSDLDPELSDPELLAYVLVHGDRTSLLGEVTLASIHTAAYWFDRTERERALFAQAAARSTRPDAAAFQALARATEWLRQLAHETLRAPANTAGHRLVPGTGLLVPAPLEREPPALAAQWEEVARDAIAAFRARWRATDRRAVAGLLEWLASAAPAVLITAHGRTLWDPDEKERLGTLRSALRDASGAAVVDIAADLRRIDAATRSFRESTVAPDELPLPAPEMEQNGYTFFAPSRRILVYDLAAPEMERRLGPAPPFARAMLGARALHEWSHLAARAGWVPRTLPDAGFHGLLGQLAAALDAAIAHAPPQVRQRSGQDLRDLEESDRAARPFVEDDDRRLVPGSSAGAALARALLTRMPDYQANLLASRLWTDEEAEVYVRHNVRTLRGHYPPSRLWRMLLRYLYEYQYLRFCAVGDPRGYFLSSTWFDDDFIAPGIVGSADFDRLASLVAAICGGYAVDEGRFHFGGRGRPPKCVGS